MMAKCRAILADDGSVLTVETQHLNNNNNKKKKYLQLYCPIMKASNNDDLPAALRP